MTKVFICFTDVYTHIHKLSLVFFFSECDRKQPVTIYLMFEITSLPTLNLSHWHSTFAKIKWLIFSDYQNCYPIKIIVMKEKGKILTQL